MGDHRPAYPRTAAPGRRAWQTLEGQPRGHQWHPLGFEKWRSVGGFARTFSTYQTCHRRFQQWVRGGVLRSVLEALAEDLRARGELDPSECFIDGIFVVAKKGGSEWERPSGAKVRSSWLAQSGFADLELVQAPARAPAYQPRCDSGRRRPRINEHLHPTGDWNGS